MQKFGLAGLAPVVATYAPRVLANAERSALPDELQALLVGDENDVWAVEVPMWTFSGATAIRDVLATRDFELLHASRARQRASSAIGRGKVSGSVFCQAERVAAGPGSRDTCYSRSADQWRIVSLLTR